MEIWKILFKIKCMMVALFNHKWIKTTCYSVFNNFWSKYNVGSFRFICLCETVYLFLIDLIYKDVTRCGFWYKFSRLILIPKSVHPLAKRSIKYCKCDGLCVSTETLSANSLYRIFFYFIIDCFISWFKFRWQKIIYI